MKQRAYKSNCDQMGYSALSEQAYNCLNFFLWKLNPCEATYSFKAISIMQVDLYALEFLKCTDEECVNEDAKKEEKEKKRTLCIC